MRKTAERITVGMYFLIFFLTFILFLIGHYNDAPNGFICDVDCSSNLPEEQKDFFR